MAAAQRGDDAAFGVLVERYTDRIYRHLYRLVGQREEAEDLTQESFVRAYRARHRFDTQREFRGWIYAIAANLGRNALRDRSRKGQAMALADLEQLTCQEEANSNLVRHELATELDAAMAELSPTAATLIDLHYREQMTLREAGSLLGMSETAAKVAVYRARKRLRKMLDRGRQT